MLASSSRLKCVKMPSQRLARKDSAGTNMPHCIISWARPMARRNVDLPPRLAPVIITSNLSSALTSLPTTLSFMLKLRQTIVEPATGEHGLAHG